MKTITLNVTNEKVEALKELAHEFSGFGVIAGGAVLDALLGKDSKDIDIFYTSESESAKDAFTHECQLNGVGLQRSGGAYSSMTFAETLDMNGQVFEFVRKDSYELICLLMNDMKDKYGWDLSKEVFEKRSFNVQPKEIQDLYEKRRRMQMISAFGDNTSMLSEYAELLIQEFDLDIKQVCIDPMTLEVKATPAFVAAFENKTISFSRLAAETRGITRRNIVRIVHSANKYGLEIQDKERVMHAFDIMEKFHTTFGVASHDPMFLKRFYETTGKLFLFPNNSSIEELESEDMHFTRRFDEYPNSGNHADARPFNYAADFLLDPWIDAYINRLGTIASVSSQVKIRRCGDAEPRLIKAFEGLINDGCSEIFERFLKDSLRAMSFYHTFRLTDFEKRPNDAKLTTYAPVSKPFLHDYKKYGLMIAIQKTKECLGLKTFVPAPQIQYVEGFQKISVPTPNLEYFIYNTTEDNMMNDRTEKQFDPSRYVFRDNIDIKTLLFEHGEGLLNYPSSEVFETMRYREYVKDRYNSKEIRSVLPVLPSGLTPQEEYAIELACQDVPELLHYSRNIPDLPLVNLVHQLPFHIDTTNLKEVEYYEDLAKQAFPSPIKHYQAPVEKEDTMLVTDVLKMLIDEADVKLNGRFMDPDFKLLGETGSNVEIDPFGAVGGGAINLTEHDMPF